VKAYTSHGRLVYACLCPLGEHVIPFERASAFYNGPLWSWNRDLEKPTLAPSIKSSGGRGGAHVCHHFLRNGRIEFCADSTHEHAGKTVELPDLSPETIALYQE